MATLSSRLAPLTVSVPAASGWTSYTPTGSFNNATYTGRWRRNGTNIECAIDIAFTTSPSAGSFSATQSQYLNGLGLTVDDSSLPNVTDVGLAIGYWTGLDSGVSAGYGGVVSMDGGSNKSIFLAIGAASIVSNTAPFSFNTGDNISIFISIPISGWTSHTASATSANALVVGGQSVGSTLSFGATSNQGFNILANNAAAIASTAAGALTLGLPSKIGSSDYAGQAIVGRTNGSAISAGHVGEVVEGKQTSITTFPTTATYGDGASVSLTSGVWLLSAYIDGELNGSTTQSILLGINTTSGNSGAGLTFGDTLVACLPPTATSNTSACLPQVIFRPTTTTTHYLKVRAEYSAGTPRYRCRLTAVRIA